MCPDEMRILNPPARHVVRIEQNVLCLCFISVEDQTIQVYASRAPLAGAFMSVHGTWGRDMIRSFDAPFYI